MWKNRDLKYAEFHGCKTWQRKKYSVVCDAAD